METKKFVMFSKEEADCFAENERIYIEVLKEIDENWPTWKKQAYEENFTLKYNSKVLV